MPDATRRHFLRALLAAPLAALPAPAAGRKTIDVVLVSPAIRAVLHRPGSRVSERVLPNPVDLFQSSRASMRGGFGRIREGASPVADAPDRFGVQLEEHRRDQSEAREHPPGDPVLSRFFFGIHAKSPDAVAASSGAVLSVASDGGGHTS